MAIRPYRHLYPFQIKLVGVNHDLHKQNLQSSDLEEIPARGRHADKGLKPLVLQKEVRKSC
jgi:hypothetical protein